MKKIALVGTLGLAFVLGCNQNSEKGTGGSSDVQQSSSERATSADAKSRTEDADNTGRNVRDRSSNTLTSGDQGEQQSDLDISSRIRKAITSNDQLSSDAKNIKIITVNGKVTLRGPVKNDQERQTIESTAKQIAGGTVDDQLEVKTSNP